MNCQQIYSFTQKDLTEVKMLQKFFFWGGATFLNNQYGKLHGRPSQLLLALQQSSIR